MSDNRQNFKLYTLRSLRPGPAGQLQSSSHLPPTESLGVKKACRGLKPFTNSGQKPWLMRERYSKHEEATLSYCFTTSVLAACFSSNYLFQNGNQKWQQLLYPTQGYTPSVMQHNCKPPCEELWLKDGTCLTGALHLPFFTSLCFLKAPQLPLRHMIELSLWFARAQCKRG